MERWLQASQWLVAWKAALRGAGLPDGDEGAGFLPGSGRAPSLSTDGYFAAGALAGAGAKASSMGMPMASSRWATVWL